MTTTDKPDIQTFDDLKRELLRSFDKVAADYGRTRQELSSDLISGVITAFMFGRAARKGNVAKTIFWGVAALNRNALSREQKREATRKREREEADKFFS